MDIRCRIGWHDWTRFGLPKKGYSRLTQFRECKKCGLVNSKDGYHDQVSTENIKESLDEGKYIID